MPMPMPDNGDMAVSPMMVRPNPIVFSALASAITPAAKPSAAAGKLTRGVLNGRPELQHNGRARQKSKWASRPT